MVRIERTDVLIRICFVVAVIDKKNFALIADALDEILRDPKPQTIEIDLRSIRRVDELGLAFLQSLKESIKDVGGRVTLVGSLDQFKQSAGQTRLANRIEDPRAVRRSHLGTRW
jgi:anti-anti-sigma regulatory factor